MKGFDPRFTNLPDYILKCTAQIWEGRDIAALDWHCRETTLIDDIAIWKQILFQTRDRE